jgi:hypothetical protein
MAEKQSASTGSVIIETGGGFLPGKCVGEYGWVFRVKRTPTLISTFPLPLSRAMPLDISDQDKLDFAIAMFNLLSA